jgi:hypothetical protein
VTPLRHYCTLFDRNYLDRGLALHRSLARHCNDFRLHVLCLDAVTHDALAALALPGMHLVTLGELQAWDAALAAARQNRSAVEFYFTCKPVLLGYLFARQPSLARVEYLDSDLWFFSSPAEAEKSYAGSSVALSPHRFDERNAWRRRYGAFNAGWVSASSGDEGRRFVAWWRERCLERCSLVVEEDRFGDQKYLDQVGKLFPGAAEADASINFGPWSLHGARVAREPAGVAVDGRPLVSFHFHGMRRMLFDVYETGLHHYGVELMPALSKGLYRPYIRELAACRRSLSALPRAIRDRLAEQPAQPGWLDYGRQALSTVAAVLRHKAVAPV